MFFSTISMTLTLYAVLAVGQQQVIAVASAAALPNLKPAIPTHPRKLGLIYREISGAVPEAKPVISHLGRYALTDRYLGFPSHFT